jgi:hypothetical protein
MFPYKEDLVRYDFEVGVEDEWMWNFSVKVDGANGINGTNGVSNNYQ